MVYPILFSRSCPREVPSGIPSKCLIWPFAGQDAEMGRKLGCRHPEPWGYLGVCTNARIRHKPKRRPELTLIVVRPVRQRNRKIQLVLGGRWNGFRSASSGPWNGRAEPEKHVAGSKLGWHRRR